MNCRAWGMTITLCSALALGACSSSRFGNAGPGPIRSAAAAPAYEPEPAPVDAVPSAPVTSAPLPPPDGGVMAGAPPMAPSGPADVAALTPPAPPPAAAPSSRSALVGNWTARDASGASCRVQLSSAPALDLYRAAAPNCANKDLARITAWDYRDGQVYLYQSGGAVAGRLRASGGGLQGILTKSGAPLALSK